MPETLTLYTAKICPYAHRVELALAETGIPHTRYEIDLANKPEWYAPKVNPASKVPAVAYGGPVTSPENPSPESQKIAESLVLLEFVADLSGKLLPKDPVLRARARFFIDAVSTKFTPAVGAILAKGEPGEVLFTAVETLQSLIAGKYAIGDDYSIADAALAPFVARLKVALKNDIGNYEPGAGLKIYATLREDARFEKFKQYVRRVEARESFKTTFNAELIKESFGLFTLHDDESAFYFSALTISLVLVSSPAYILGRDAPRTPSAGVSRCIQPATGSVFNVRHHPLRLPSVFLNVVEGAAPALEEVIKAARVTVDVLDDLGYNCCLFGGLACVLYGMDYRDTKNVDIIVLTRKSHEIVKKEVANHSNRFFLKPSTSPDMTYQKLYFKGPHLSSSRRGPRKEIKIDILVPGVIHIPKIPFSKLVYRSEYPDIPLVPLMTLTLLKLQGWYVNSRMMGDQRWKRRRKAPKDERDVKELLELVWYRGMSEGEEWCPRYLRRMAGRWVKAFVRKNERYERFWEGLSFEVDDC